MQKYTEKKFSIPKLDGISEKNIEEHLALYSGYVKNINIILEKTEELEKDPEKNLFLLGELRRRFGFEFNGMRNHEYYFASLESGAEELQDGELKKMIKNQFGSFDLWLRQFKTIGMTRGIGWAMLFYDPIQNNLVNFWVDEQHIGQPNSLQIILGLDMWEHAYLRDYPPISKGKYIDAFFRNVNWKNIESNLNEVLTSK